MKRIGIIGFLLLSLAAGLLAEPVSHTITGLDNAHNFLSLTILGNVFPQLQTLPFTFDGSRNLLVNCAVGCGGGGSSSITSWGGGTLGAMATYGTSPGAVLVPGVNAFVTNPVAVTGTFWQSIQPV